ncbi:MAG: dTDP-4-dehydrorhamnose 3,5-epimerase [Chitinophagales bacterium]|nr:dTDP-4-dehydrorhamnose 3,5-epimerase [Chitinophagales bacterium]
MQVEQTPLKDCFIIRDTVIKDSRGYFFESFNKKKFFELTGLDIDFVQDNQSKSSKGVVRGLHYQKGEFSQAKLVRVLKGKVLDVAVDLRRSSPTFGKHISVELTEDNNTQLFVPRGFAHGFAVLSDEAIFFYKCDNYYNKEQDTGIFYNDLELNINWQLNKDEIIVSEKDTNLPLFKDAVYFQ